MSTARILRAVAVLALAGVGACSDSDDDSGGAGGDAAGTGASSAGTGASSAGTGASSAGTGAGSGGRGEAGTSMSGAGAMASGAGGMDAAGAGAAGMDAAGSGSQSGSGGAGGAGGAQPTAEEVSDWIDDYMTAHPGMDGDITSKTPAQLAADPDAQRLANLCGEDQRPVIPKLVWEYGGASHAWAMPETAALVYCVYTPVSPSSEHWQYDAAEDHVVADVYVLFPEQNPCKDETGADQVAMCIGEVGNYEILVDTASMNDGTDAGLSLSEASTELRLVLPDGTAVHLWDDA